jgi:hypothetical protein
MNHTPPTVGSQESESERMVYPVPLGLKRLRIGRMAAYFFSTISTRALTAAGSLAPPGLDGRLPDLVVGVGLRQADEIWQPFFVEEIGERFDRLLLDFGLAVVESDRLQRFHRFLGRLLGQAPYSILPRLQVFRMEAEVDKDVGRRRIRLFQGQDRKRAYRHQKMPSCRHLISAALPVRRLARDVLN